MHIEWMLAPLRPLMDGLLQNHSTCGFQIRIPPDPPTRYKHTPTDMQTRGRPSARTGRALPCLPNGTELMDTSESTCKNHVFTRQTKEFRAFLCLVLPFFRSLSIRPPGSSRGFFSTRFKMVATSLTGQNVNIKLERLWNIFHESRSSALTQPFYLPESDICSINSHAVLSALSLKLAEKR